MGTVLDTATDTTQEYGDVPERAGQAHLWFKADSPAGPVFVAHSNGWVSGLLIMPEGSEPDPGRFVDYMRDEVGTDVEPDPDPDPKLVARVSEALATGRTDVPVDLDGKTVALVDDVFYSGRTARAALNALIDLGRPRAVQLAVLIDRGHHELPIRADYVGKNVPTSLNEEIQVRVAEIDGVEEVALVRHDREVLSC